MGIKGSWSRVKDHEAYENNYKRIYGDKPRCFGRIGFLGLCSCPRKSECIVATNLAERDEDEKGSADESQRS